MRDPLHWLSVKYKLALLFVGLCVIAFGVGGTIVSSSSRNALEKEILTRVAFQSRAYATALDSHLALLTSRIEDFASDGYIRSHTTSITETKDEAGLARLRSELAQHLRVNKLPLVREFAALAVTYRGKSVLGKALPPDVRDFARIGEDRDGIRYGGLLDGEGGQPSMLISAPLLGLDRRGAVGRLIVRVRVGAWIAGAMASIDEPDAGQGKASLRIRDRAGRVLIVPASMTAGDWTHGQLRVEPAAGTTPPAKRSFSATRGTYAEAFEVARNDWRVTVELEASEILDAVSGLQSELFGYGILLAVAAGLLLYFPMRYIVRPLEVLEEAARRIKEGQLETRVEIETGGEIGELSEAFNAMATALEERAVALRQKQHELVEGRERLETVIASLRDGLVVIDDAGETVLANAAAKPVMAWLASSGGTPHYDCRLHPARGKDCKSCFFDAAAPSRSCVVDIGSNVYEVHAVPLRTGAGGRGGRVLRVSDITHRLEHDEAEIHQERLAVLGEVAAVMAHELNNPLTAITMFDQMLASELPDDSPLQEHVEVIKRNTDTCKRTIRELLDYATGATPELAPLEVDALIDDVIRFLRPLSNRAGVTVRHEPGDVATVSGDEVQLRQVVVNLVMNAIQASSSSSGEVTLQARRTGDFVHIDVRDNGGGIDAADAEKIFRPFYTSKPRGIGTGLGLPTARRIVEIQGGTLTLVESHPGGTVFRVRLRCQGSVAIPECPPTT